MRQGTLKYFFKVIPLTIEMNMNMKRGKCNFLLNK